jgi:hypothetical protein
VTSGNRTYAIPSSMIEQATENKPESAAKVRNSPAVPSGWATAIPTTTWHLLGDGNAAPPPARRHWILLVKGGYRAGRARGRQPHRQPGSRGQGRRAATGPRTRLAGATVLGNGEVALIINPVALATHAPERSSSQVQVVVAGAETPADCREAGAAAGPATRPRRLPRRGGSRDGGRRFADGAQDQRPPAGAPRLPCADRQGRRRRAGATRSR